jgi:Uma2 family endonuclease
MVRKTPQSLSFRGSEADARFLATLEDDTEDAPWMVMSDLQFWPTAAFAEGLRYYARSNHRPWYVASMLPIHYRDRAGRRHQRAPDTFVARAPDRPRDSYDLAEEGVFPAFVLEVVSPSSVRRDQEEKREAYRILGAEEYALFTPRLGAPSTLAGHRRAPDGTFAPWLPDAQGRLWSETLELYLVARDEALRAQPPDGAVLPTYEEAQAARLRDAEARYQAEIAREREAEARRQLEAEVARLRRQLEGRLGPSEP